MKADLKAHLKDIAGLVATLVASTIIIVMVTMADAGEALAWGA